MIITQKRNYTLDIARILAVIAVVMIHSSAPFVSKHKPFTTEHLVGNIFNSISRFGVPMFLMISGSLFLDERKEVTLKKIFTKNVISLAVITVLWAVIYSVIHYALFPHLDNKPINTKKLIDAICVGHYHMWYLYMIIGLYCITPFLKKFVVRENSRMVLLFIAFSLLGTFLPYAINMANKLGADLTRITAVLKKLKLEFFSGYIAYFMTGWYITHIGLKKKLLRYLVYVLGLASLACMFTYVRFTGDYKTAYADLGFFNYIYSFSVFLALSNLKINLGNRSAKLVTQLSKLTFGVYIIHCIFLSVYDREVTLDCHPILQLAAKFSITLCVSFLATYIISKIPLLKKMIKA